jgi:hypothetical protein
VRLLPGTFGALLVALPLAACSGSSSNGATTASGATCSSVCDHVASLGLACSPATADCATQCAQGEGTCASDVAGYQSYLDCLQGASYTCDASGNVSVTCTAPACLSGPVASPDGGGATGEAGAPTSPAACAAATTQDACFACCQTLQPTGINTFDNALLACECGGNGTAGACTSACATELCAASPVNPPNGDPCDTCVTTSLQTGGACVTPIQNACNADPSCSAYLSCAGGCQQPS